VGEGQEAGEEGGGITGVSSTPVTHNERGLVSFDNNLKKTNPSPYCNFAYSALAAMRMGMSESASFQSVRKS
jgi:hypothetical protein